MYKGFCNYRFLVETDDRRSGRYRSAFAPFLPANRAVFKDFTDLDIGFNALIGNQLKWQTALELQDEYAGDPMSRVTGRYRVCLPSVGYDRLLRRKLLRCADVSQMLVQALPAFLV